MRPQDSQEQGVVLPQWSLKERPLEAKVLAMIRRGMEDLASMPVKEQIRKDNDPGKVILINAESARSLGR